MSQDLIRVILGTAGHIDHGKTSLVRRLTGIDTDRLPEEKKRGITIDLGFANLDLPGVRVGIVDVPGHEKFVHNMVAGATGVDLAMLVVAADDSVMPQTREHLSILHLLGHRNGLVAITKADLVDHDTLELVKEELKEVLAGTFLENAPMVPVSSVTGEGLEELKSEITRLAATVKRGTHRQVFRMPIDRVFAMEGHGTIVTGTVLSGQANLGDSLVVMPQDQTVRIRKLQSHKSEVDSIVAGQRAAVNLAGIKSDELHRGDELTVPGYLAPSRRILAEITVLPQSRALEDRQSLRLHVATREVTVRALLKGGRIEPGETGFAEFRSREAILADYGQRFIIRQLSPVVTIGGGMVVDPRIPVGRRIRNLTDVGTKLAAKNPLERLAGWLEDNDLDELTPHQLACRLGIDPAQKDSLVEKLLDAKRLIRLPRGQTIHRVRRDSLGDQILIRYQRELKRRQPSRLLDRSVLLHACRRLASPAMIDAMVDDLISREKLVKSADKLGLPGQRATLTKNQQKILNQLLESAKSGAASPPLISELSKSWDVPIKELENLARVAIEDGLLVHVGDGLYYDPAVIQGLVRNTADRIQKMGPATVAELRDLWGVSRKHAVPLCEYLDSLGITRREGDTRVLGPNAHLR